MCTLFFPGSQKAIQQLAPLGRGTVRSCSRPEALPDTMAAFLSPGGCHLNQQALNQHPFFMCSDDWGQGAHRPLESKSNFYSRLHAVSCAELACQDCFNESWGCVYVGFMSPSWKRGSNQLPNVPGSKHREGRGWGSCVRKGHHGDP